MPLYPLIRITNDPRSGVIADGSWDSLSDALMRRAGFQANLASGSSGWRVPDGLETAEENEIASRAYEMLTAARYDVSIAPELRCRPSAAAREINALAAEIRQATSNEAVTDLLATLSDQDHGVIPALSRLLVDAGIWAGERLPDETSTASILPLFAAADAIGDALGDLADAERELLLPSSASSQHGALVTAATGLRMAAARSRSAAAGPSALAQPASAHQPSSTTAALRR